MCVICRIGRILTRPYHFSAALQSDLLVREIKGIKFLVIDEADRMIENGHFAELDNIVRLTRRTPYVAALPPLTSC